MTAGEIAERFSCTWPTTSRHLRVLESAGLVRVEKRGRARAAGRRLSTLTLEAEVRFRSAEDRNAFAEELAADLARLAVKYHDQTADGGRAFRFFVGCYPAASPNAKGRGREGGVS